jgi:hypothetical protein
MALEFEQLTEQIAAMVESAGARLGERQKQLEAVLSMLHTHRTNWVELEQALVAAQRVTLLAPTPRPYSAAMPFDVVEPLDTAVSPPLTPTHATMIATDGSQIVPDRHAPLVYNLINIGGLVYFHGRERVPEPFTQALLTFPPADELNDQPYQDNDSISLQRDGYEIQTLADKVKAYRAETPPAEPLLAIMDQRLLYVPVGEITRASREQAVKAWQASMGQIRQQKAWLIGYIDRPAKSSVITMLHALTNPSDPTQLGRWTGLTDRDLFAELLPPGHRSKLFVDVSLANQTFKKENAQLEICFFYLNPGRSGQEIARVDLPRWVAEDDTAVAHIHALIISQCQLLGNEGRYPYIITRADEIAVVQQPERERLEFLISRKLLESGIHPTESNKQLTKQFARSLKQRY